MLWNMEEARALERAISRGRYPSAYAMLRKRTELLTRIEAEPCLQAALYRSPLLFRSLLEKCVPGEHTGCVLVGLGEDTKAQVDGDPAGAGRGTGPAGPCANSAGSRL